MARNPDYQIKANTLDRSGEKTSITANTADFVAVSAGIPATLTAFLTAFADYTEFAAANITSVSSGASRKVSGGLRYGVGHRELKWELIFTDNITLSPYSVTVPLAINADAIAEGTDFLPNALWAGTDIETTAEALFRSPDGNAGTLTAIRLVRGAK